MALTNYVFNDITNKDMPDFRFNDTEEFLGHKFFHIGDGIFKAEEPFDMTPVDMRNALDNYKRGVCVFSEITGKRRFGDSLSRENKIHVMYAMNTEWCNVCLFRYSSGPDVFVHWLAEHNEGDNIEYAETEIAEGIKGIEYKKDYLIVDYNIASSYLTAYSTEPNEKRCSLTAFEPTNLIEGALGVRPYLNIKGRIGWLVEPGIYYFPEDDPRYRANYVQGEEAEIDINDAFEVPCAMLGIASYDFSPFAAVRYLAVGERAMRRLKDIVKKNTRYFYHEFKVKEKPAEDASDNKCPEEQDRPDTVFTGTRVDEINRHEEIFKAQRAGGIGLLIRKNMADVIVSGIDGVDYRDMNIYYKTLLREPHKSEHYDFVYVSGDRLVMENISAYKDEGRKDWKCEIKAKTVCLDIITKLIVSAEIPLKNGIRYPLNVEVFNREQEVKVRFIKPEMIGLLDGEEEIVRSYR